MESTISDQQVSSPDLRIVGRAAVVVAPGEIRIEEIQPAEPGRGEVRVRIDGCGLCPSALPLWEGREWFSYPMEPGAPGHEAWGRIDAIGEDVEGFEEDDRVAVLSYHGFADYDIAPSSAVVKLPDSLDGLPFPGEPLACAVNVMARSEIEEGQTIAIIGTGFLGALLTCMATDAGANVIAVSRRSSSLDIARQYGARHVVLMDDHQRIIDEVMNITGSGCERVIEATGAQWPLDLAGELTAERGRLIIAGYHQDGPRQVNMQLWNWRGIDVINAHEREAEVYMSGMRRAVELVRDGRLDFTPLLTHKFSLDELSSAFDIMKNRPEGFVRGWISMEESR